MQQQDEPEPGEAQLQQLQTTAIAAIPQRMQRPDECGVCLFAYDDLDRRPRTLPCGHTYCSLCVTVLLEDYHLICPSCRTDHCAPDINHFPINYGMEAVMKMRPQQIDVVFQAGGEALQATGEATQATEVNTKRRVTAGLSRKLRSMVHEQKVTIQSLETTLQKEVDQLNQYRAKLAVSRTEHANLLQELDNVVQRHQANMDLLQEEDVRVEVFVAEGEEAQRELRAAQCQLDQVNTAQEAFTTIDAADHIIVQSEEWLQHSRDETPNGTVLSTSFRIRKATKAALKVIKEETEATPDQATSGHSNCTVMEAVESILAKPVELGGLHTEELKKEVEAGRAFATQEYADGTCYSSRIICKENKVYLHALKNEPTPRAAFTLQVSKALKDLTHPNFSVFLDLAWPGTSSQRVHIKLVADTPLTRQFVTLCLGHTGLTYRNTKFITVENKSASHSGRRNLFMTTEDYSSSNFMGMVTRPVNCYGERNYKGSRIIWGGDIRGQKAAANQVLPPIQGIKCDGTVVLYPGMVVARCGLSSYAESRTHFGIVLDGSHNNGNNPPLYHIGSVDAAGQRVVQRAANSTDGGLTQVTVVDCGVVYDCSNVTFALFQR